MFTTEEAIVMRAFAAGKSEKQVRLQLHMPSLFFHRVLRALMEKTGTSDRVALLVWAVRQQGVRDSRASERD
jgi:DNA-binding NarL/FixJ family response regulator